MTDLGLPGRGMGTLPTGAVLILAAMLATIPLFWLGFVSLGEAWIRPEYSHGPLIPFISLFLFLRELRDRPATGPRGPAWPGLLLGLLALAVALVGTRTAIPDIVTYGLVLWVMALVLVAMGWSRGRHHWAPILHLVFMLPLPMVVQWTTTTWLQTVSAEIGVAIVRAADIPVLLEGHIIDLGVYQLQVAEACAGLRYIFPILSFSYLTAILYRGPMVHKIVLFAMAAPLAVLLNAVRIGIIGILVDRFGISHAEGFLHIFEGWVIFGICLLILMASAALLARLRRVDGPILDLDVSGLWPQAARIGGARPALPLLALALMTALASLATTRLTPAQSDIPRVPLAVFPMDLGGWTGQTATLAPDIAEVLGATDYLDATYAAPNQPPVQLFVAWYARQGRGAGLHSPEICLPAAGWEIASIETRPTTIAGDTFPANHAIIVQGLRRQMVLYWFDQRGTRLAGDWEAKFSAVRDSLLTGRSDGALVRFVTPIGPDETDAEAGARLLALAETAVPRLAPHIPK
ncbi:MAG: VPLPA-CTERM-specific exosortase XrtD [Pseudomonadota bacterium]